MTEDPTSAAEAVAIIGMSGRYPGAPDLDHYWANLLAGRCSLTDFDEAELLAAGVPAEELRRADYVPTKGWLADADRFDRERFGFNRTEAAALDPQHRLLLQAAWSALADAALDPSKPPQSTGVYVGGGLTEHALAAQTDGELAATLGALQVRIFTDREFLAPWVSYRLGLEGPSVGVQTACSSSLTAVHLAAQALLLGECHTALVGGVAVDSVRPGGYRYQPGGIFSPDGRCRPFSADAAGTVPGNGVGVVVLRRLTDALEDGDPVRAVIRGTAVTNDGRGKLGFTAPGVEGQTAAIAEAWAAAGLDPATAQYLEAHGTGTELGDRVEIAAASTAFAAAPAGRMAIGSVKANIGHLDAAGGVAALQKAVLQLERRVLVPDPWGAVAHPELHLADTPFRLPAAAEQWESPDGAPRRAGVTSVGIGGTNVHVVLEQAPEHRSGSGSGSGSVRGAAPADRHARGEALGALSLTRRDASPAGDASPDGDIPAAEADDVRSGITRLLVEALGLDGPQSLEDSYLAVGGDSLAAVTIVGRIHDEHGVDVPMTHFLEEMPMWELVDRIAAHVAEDPLGSLLDALEAEEE